MKRLLGGAAVGLAGFCLAASAHATVVDFEDLVIPQPYTHMANNLVDGGLHFMDQDFTLMPANSGTLPLNSATQFVELGNGNDAIDPNLVISLNSGGAFNLNSLKMGLGDENDQTPDGYDLVKIVGTKAANCQFDCDAVTAMLHVTDSWQTFNLSGFTGLASVTVFQQIYIVDGQPTITPTSIANQAFVNMLNEMFPGFDFPVPPLTTIDGGWLAFDDVNYSEDPTGGVGVNPNGGGAAVPEPAAWALMIAGFGLARAALRRRRTLVPAR